MTTEAMDKLAALRVSKQTIQTRLLMGDGDFEKLVAEYAKLLGEEAGLIKEANAGAIASEKVKLMSAITALVDVSRYQELTEEAIINVVWQRDTEAKLTSIIVNAKLTSAKVKVVEAGVKTGRKSAGVYRNEATGEVISARTLSNTYSSDATKGEGLYAKWATAPKYLKLALAAAKVAGVNFARVGDPA